MHTQRHPISGRSPRNLDHRYELRQSIGRGGMAEVYLAWDHLLEREVAIKVLVPVLAREASAVERFRREGLALARVDSARVSRILDVHIGDEHSYLVLRHVVGRGLDRMIAATGPLAPTRALQIVADVLEGLREIHACGLVHRDLKPSNVLVDRDDRAVVIDLGIAHDRRQSALTPAESTMGTPGYMAPEHVYSGDVDVRSDIYQVGLLLLFATTTLEPRGRAGGPVDPDALMQVPSPLAAIIVRATHEDPAQRYQRAGDMLDAVQQARSWVETVDLDLEALAAVELACLEDPDPLALPVARRAPAAVDERWISTERIGSTLRGKGSAFALLGIAAAMMATVVAPGAGRAPAALHAAAAPRPVVVAAHSAAELVDRPVALAIAAAASRASRPPGATASAATPSRPAPSHLAARPTARRAIAPASRPTSTEGAVIVAARRQAAIPEDPAAFRELALASEQNGANEAAIAAWRQYLRLTPDAADRAEVTGHLMQLAHAP